MAVPPQLTQLAFAGGFDESQRAEVLDPMAAFTNIENARQVYEGGVGKRLGFTSLALTRLDATSRSAGNVVFQHNDAVGVIDGTYIETFAAGASVNVVKDRVPEALPTRVPLPYCGGKPDPVDILYVNGYIITATLAYNASLTSLTVAATIIDANGYAVLRNDVIATGLALNNHVTLTNVGNTVVVVYGSAANTLSGRTISVASTSGINTGWSGATALCTDWGSFGTCLDVTSFSDRFALAYRNNLGGTNRLSVRTFNGSLVQQETTTINTSSTNPSGCSVAGNTGDTLWVSWSETTSVKVIGLTITAIGTPLATAATIITTGANSTIQGMVVTGTGSGRLVACDGDLYTRAFTTSAGATTTSGSTETWYRLLLLTRPFAVGSKYYCCVGYFDATGTPSFNTQRVHACVEIGASSGTLRPVAVMANRQSIFDTVRAVAHYAAISSTKIGVIDVIQKSSLNIDTGAGLEMHALDFASSKRWQTCSFGGQTYVSGGVTSVFDGDRLMEANFLLRPDKPTTSLGGTGVTGTGLRYVAVYEHSDGNGNVSWSATSDPSDAVSPVNQTVTITLSTLMLTTRHDTSSANSVVRIAVYVSGDNGAAPYRRVGSVANVTSATSVTITHTGSAANNQRLYRQPGTNGTEQTHQSPPASHMLVPYGDMLVAVGDDLLSLWYSAQPIDGEGVWFSDIFRTPLTEGGPITGIAAQDGSLFVFKRRGIFVIGGDAPVGNGSSGGLGTPRRLAVDVGCIEPKSIVVTSLGIFFQSERGLEILTRGQAVEPIGTKIQTTLAAYPNVTAATLDTKQGLVRISLADTIDSATGRPNNVGVDVVFDLTLKRWVSRDFKITSTGTPTVASAMLYVGGSWRYGWLAANGTVYYEKLSSDATAYLDATSTWVAMKVETAWFKASGIQGKQHLNRALMLAKRETAHGLSMHLAYDYSSTYKSPRSWTESEVTTLASALPNLQVVHQPHDESPTQAVRLKILDSAPVTVGTGQGATWLALTLDITPMQGAYELPDTAA